jgi:large subunit ribosomal protein L16
MAVRLRLRPHPKVRRAGLGRPLRRPAAWVVVATAYGRLRREQLEAARKTVRRRLRREGRLRLGPLPHLTLTAKPLQSRMGRGKGRPAATVSPVRPGQLLLSLEGVAPHRARAALLALGPKLPVPLRVRSLDRLHP